MDEIGKEGCNNRAYSRAHAFVSAAIHKPMSENDGVGALNNEALVLNLSAGGAMLLTTVPAVKSDVFGVSISIVDERIIFVDVEVCWRFGDMIGVKFLDLEEADKAILENAVLNGDGLGDL